LARRPIRKPFFVLFQGGPAEHMLGSKALVFWPKAILPKFKAGESTVQATDPPAPSEARKPMHKPRT
jgi:hypothetical protein